KGFAVQKLATEAEAEEHLKNNRPDIVVMGLMLEYPDSGFILSHRIKQKDPALPIIMVTSVARKMGFSFEAATEEERSWVKADVVMDEPVRFEQLWNEAEKLLRRN
ncbi:MAG TPA: response regulator, partial [Elusimicrobiota bacterium]|nr:response regulator [Elusimicrobiota bacterium]